MGADELLGTIAQARERTLAIRESIDAGQTTDLETLLDERERMLAAVAAMLRDHEPDEEPELSGAMDGLREDDRALRKWLQEEKHRTLRALTEIRQQNGEPYAEDAADRAGLDARV